MTQTPISVLAPAKINLFLRVTGKREDGYHLLQSLVAFADKGDTITLEPADKFSLTIRNNKTNIGTDAENLVTQAVEKLCGALGKKPDFAITLDKDIPVGAGLGGGSADAAATVKAVLKYWNATLSNETLNDILISLGADVPVCYKGTPCFVEGIGDVISPVTNFKKIPAILVHPNIECPTAPVFKKFSTSYSKEIILDNGDIDFIKEQKNDLTAPAIELVPEIKAALTLIEKQNGCELSRMSGSGSACFGLFQTEEDSRNAAENIQKEKPDWWVRPVILQ